MEPCDPILKESFNVDYNDNIPENKWWIEGNPFWKVERFEGSWVFAETGSDY